MVKRYEVEAEYSKSVAFYKLQLMINANTRSSFPLYPNENPSTELHSGIYMCLDNYKQTPANYLGIRYIKPPSSDENTYRLPRKWDPVAEGIPIMKQFKVQKHYNVVC